MDLFRLSIPYAFLRKRLRLTWRSVRFGLENGLIGPDVPRELAVDQVGDMESPHPALLEIAGAGEGESIDNAVNLLADREAEGTEESLRAAWLYLVLAWTYENKAAYADPLQRVEEIYADFGYPQCMVGFVRYMPMEGPDLGSREANERRLYERWQRYLDESAELTHA